MAANSVKQLQEQETPYSSRISHFRHIFVSVYFLNDEPAGSHSDPVDELQFSRSGVAKQVNGMTQDVNRPRILAALLDEIRKRLASLLAGLTDDQCDEKLSRPEAVDQQTQPENRLLMQTTIENAFPTLDESFSFDGVLKRAGLQRTDPAGRVQTLSPQAQRDLYRGLAKILFDCSRDVPFIRSLPGLVSLDGPLSGALFEPTDLESLAAASIANWSDLSSQTPLALRDSIPVPQPVICVMIRVAVSRSASPSDVLERSAASKNRVKAATDAARAPALNKPPVTTHGISTDKKATTAPQVAIRPTTEAQSSPDPLYSLLSAAMFLQDAPTLYEALGSDLQELAIQLGLKERLKEASASSIQANYQQGSLLVGRLIESRINSLGYPNELDRQTEQLAGMLDAPLATVGSLLSRRLGPVVRATDAYSLARRLTRDASRDYQRVAAEILIRAAGYRTIGQWFVQDFRFEEIESLLSKLEQRGSTDGYIDEATVRTLTDHLFGDENQRDEFLTGTLRLARFAQGWLITDTPKNRVSAALRLIGKPATRHEVAEVAALDSDAVAAYLSSSPNIVRAKPGYWFFRESVSHPYEGLPKAIDDFMDWSLRATLTFETVPSVKNIVAHVSSRYGIDPMTIYAELRKPRYANLYDDVEPLRSELSRFQTTDIEVQIQQSGSSSPETAETPDTATFHVDSTDTAHPSTQPEVAAGAEVSNGQSGDSVDDLFSELMRKP